MSKTPPKKTTTPQPTEAILTRNKSAQQGRQLRQKDRSMKAITQLLKSTSHKTSTAAGQLKKNTEKDKNVTVKKGSQKGSSTKKVLSADTNFLESKELLPNMLKKKIPEKKITLKPKYEMKVIARTNKRKLNTPHKESMPSPTPTKTETGRSSDNEEIYRPSRIEKLRAEMSIEDIIRLSEETDCLDDEDLLEIVTCPSPVWWEDPPDESYVEEPIFMYIPTNNKKDADDSILNKPTETKRKTEKDDDTFDIVVKINDKRILEKRSKLEKILGNIKNKLTTSKDKEIPNSSEIGKECDKSDRPTKEIVNVGNDLNKVTINSEGNEYNVMLSDISINGEELLKELENMDIPIEGDTNNIDKNSDNKLASENSNSIVKMKLIDKLNNETRLTDTDKDTAKTTSQLEKNPLRRLNTDSSNVSEDATSCSEIDSISDSNVQYLDDDENDIAFVDSNSPIDDKLDAKTKDLSVKDTQFFLDDDKKKLITVSTDTEAMTDFESYIDKSDFITVYKIMSQKYSDEENGANRDNTQPNTKENNNKNISTVKHNDTKLNLFFKKRKSNTKHSKRIVKKPKVDASSVCDSCKGNSFIPIPDSNKKLCLRCSSIYDESCTFCTTNDSEKKCTCEGKNKTSKVVYSCNVCEFIANTLLEARRHLKASHNNEIARRAWNKCFTLINND